MEANKDSKSATKELKQMYDEVNVSGGCFYCMNRRQVNRPREGRFASLDGRGNFDLFQCEMCREHKWIRCIENASDAGVSRGQHEPTPIDVNGVKLLDAGS